MRTDFIGKQDSFLMKRIIFKTSADWAYVKSFGDVNPSFRKKYFQGTCLLYSVAAHLMTLRSIASKYPRFLPFYKWMSSLLPFRNRKKIILTAAFGTLVDEIVDTDIKGNVETNLEKILFGESKLSKKKQTLRNIAKDLVRQGLDLDIVMVWAKKEESNRKRKKDLKGICFRDGGCAAAAKLLTWAIGGSKQDEKDLYKVALLVQMVDDFIDIKDDKKSNVRTPVTQGVWTEESIIKSFNEIITDFLLPVKNKHLHSLAKESINWFAYKIITEMQADA